MKTIRINNLDLAYTIDTYGTFTGDWVDEIEAVYYSEEYGLSADQIGFDYDHKGVVQDLASASVQLLHENFVQHGDGIVAEINLEKSTSPRFYNYTTDSYIAEWTIDVDKLTKYIEGQRDASKWIMDNWTDYWKTDKNSEDYDEEYCIVAMLDYYTRQHYDVYDYIDHMYEYSETIWMENMAPSEDMQKLIDNKEAIKL